MLRKIVIIIISVILFAGVLLADTDKITIKTANGEVYEHAKITLFLFSNRAHTRIR